MRARIPQRIPAQRFAIGTVLKVTERGENLLSLFVFAAVIQRCSLVVFHALLCIFAVLYALLAVLKIVEKGKYQLSRLVVSVLIQPLGIGINILVFRTLTDVYSLVEQEKTAVELVLVVKGIADELNGVYVEPIVLCIPVDVDALHATLAVMLDDHYVRVSRFCFCADPRALERAAAAG